EVRSGRVHWLQVHFKSTISWFLFHFHSIAWSVLGLGWFVAFKYADIGRRAVPFLATLFCLSFLLFVSGDETRVLAIITFPLVAVYWLLDPQFLNSISKRETSIVFLLWAIMPMSFVWGGKQLWSVFPYDVFAALHALLGFSLRGDLYWTPFY
ncbi:MAG: hypothetical protein NTX21_13090, partial [Alphaproteobacteria bacterium]|nr:hypothetical protein [Alphaproteobacteria bacterium]